VTACLAGSHKVETFSGGKNYLRRGFLIILDFLARAFSALRLQFLQADFLARNNFQLAGGDRNLYNVGRDHLHHARLIS